MRELEEDHSKIHLKNEKISQEFIHTWYPHERLDKSLSPILTFSNPDALRSIYAPESCNAIF